MKRFPWDIVIVVLLALGLLGTMYQAGVRSIAP